jgi:predicted dehydrogenase
MKQPVTMIVIGAGGRGTGYAQYAQQHPDRLQIVGVAEPRPFYRERLAREHRIPAGHVFTTWEDVAARPRFADAVVIATMDQLHADPAVACARLGYHILVEKPLAPTEAECRRMVKAARDAKVLFAVCHVLRYTPYTRRLKQLLDAGAVGQIVSLQHLEPVGYWHQAHSYVRGQWARESTSTFMLMAKSCHDLDWIRYVMDRPCRRVSSFGSRLHFRHENRPAGAADRCLDCGVESACPYSARKIYLDRLARGERGWPVSVLAPEVSDASIREALRHGPYGRCVYACDNDVVDHQVVNLEFEGGPTAVFTMTAFTEGNHRKTRIFGTRGEIECNGDHIRHFDFLTDRWTDHTLPPLDGTLAGGHGGGDYFLMQHFVDAVAGRDPARILSGPDESLESHLMVFAAEQARHAGQVVPVPAP